jgi:hypothetical protein
LDQWGKIPWNAFIGGSIPSFSPYYSVTAYSQKYLRQKYGFSMRNVISLNLISMPKTRYEE